MNSPSGKADPIVRPMQPADAAAVSGLIAQLGYERSAQQVLAWIASAGDGREQTAFVACLGDEVAGWIEIAVERRLQSEPFVLIGGLVVKDGMRGQGIGRRLLQCAEAWSWERKVETVRVTSRSTRLDAHQFYARGGYETVKTSVVFEKHRPG